MTNEAIGTLLGHILDKLNRVEAMVADMKPATPAPTDDNSDVLRDTIEDAISIFGKAVGDILARQHKNDGE
ncbi:hypothetical protein [Sphingomonas sp. CCH5-D11]|uniref:hypothetical protein n=1 Tax=Sphingomonas sp. CCH5-D11 TaxID=1768786 RepID=UPI0008309EEF|nr:hypothetical protein [Sphingomonas sp. CCH5-D11]